MRGVVGAYRRLLGNRPLTHLLAGEFISSIGDWLYLVALLIIIYERTQDGVLLGIVGAARVLPYVFLSIPAGIVADRFDRRMILLVTDLGRGALMVILAWLVTTDASIEAIVAVTILATCLSSFFGPAIGAYLPSLVKDESDLGPANTAYASLDNIAFVVGPAAAALILGVTNDLALAFLLNAASFAIVAGILWRLPPSLPGGSATSEEGPAGKLATGQVPGWRAIRLPVMGLMLFDLVESFVFGGIGVLTVVIAYDLPGGGAEATGALNAAVGIGGLIGALVSGVLVLRRRLAPPLVLGAVVMGASVAVLGVSGSLGVAMVAMAVVALGSLLASIVTETLFQRIVPDQLRGRALGIMSTVSVLMMAAGALLVPSAVEWFGLGPVLAVCGIAIVVSVLVAVAVLGPWAVQTPPADAMRALLTALPIFNGLPPGRLETAERRSVVVSMRAGDVVIRQGDPADRFYVIGEGEVEVTQVGAAAGPPALLRRMGAGEGFGEIGLLSGIPRTATVTARTDGTLVALDGDAFLDLVNGVGVTFPFMELHRGSTAAQA
jgi:MFS family permease